MIPNANSSRAARLWVYGLLVLAAVFAWLRQSAPLNPTVRTGVQGDGIDGLMFWRRRPTYLVFSRSRDDSMYFWLVVACVAAAAGVAVWGVFRRYVRPHKAA